ncbi:MAG: tRNA/rRNA methyltransferase [Candidatus Omnitrophota bacterium]|jgi:tRNA/rRNA methyltransferase
MHDPTKKKPDPRLSNIRVVLVQPMYGGNVGSVCRAMKNMGIHDLVLVNPLKHDMKELRMMAVRAIDVYDNHRRFDTLAEAVADCGAVAATSARDGFYRDHAYTLRDGAPKLLDVAAGQPVALVFGREDSGLGNDDLKLATHIIRIPTSATFSSLNLSQAVMTFCYELFTAAEVFTPPKEISPEAPIAFRERMFDAWKTTLLDIGFFEEAKSEHMMMGLRRILTRGKLTTNDVKIMMGIAKQAHWAANHKKAKDDDEE